VEPIIKRGRKTSFVFVVGRLPTTTSVHVRHVREAILEVTAVLTVDPVVLPRHADVEEASLAADEAKDSHEHVLSLSIRDQVSRPSIPGRSLETHPRSRWSRGQ